MKQPRFYLLGDSSANNPSAISKEQIELWESEGIIEYLGVCDDVRGIIEACDCVVLPSYKEGAPRILLEAMALSKPIITTDTAGCKECIKAPLNCHNGVLLGANGILVPLKDSLALKEAICYLCENPHLLKSMGESGAEFAKRFDVRGVVEIYKKAISNANSSSRSHSTDLANFEAVITDEVTPAPKSTKNYESTSANTRILGESQSDFVESNLHCEGVKQPKQSINKINPHEVPPNLAPLRGAKKEEQGGSSASALLELECDIASLSPKSVPKACEHSEAKTAAACFSFGLSASHQPLARCVGERGGGAALFAKKSDYMNCEMAIESRRSERVESNAESAETAKDSIDSSDSKITIDCHKSQGDFGDDNSRAIPRKIPDFHNGDFSQDSSHSAKSPKHSPTKALAFISNTCFGMWNFRLPVLKSLQKDGFVVHILAPTDNSRAKLENEGFFVHSISIDSKGLNPLKDIKTAMQIYKILSTIKPSVVFSYTIKCVIYGSFVANMLKIPNIAIITGLGYVFIGQSARKKILQNIVSKMYAIALRKTKSVWFLNNDDKSEFIKRHIIAESKSFLLNSEGVDLEHFSPKCGVKSGILPDRIEGEIRFILIARMLWDKGVGEFVEAARKIVDSTTAMGGG